MISDDSLSPLIVKYADILEKNPKSQAFAPLADLYRKIGLIDKALEILKKGICHHPNCLTGYLNLAACYIDKGQNHLAYTTLRSMVKNYRDNLKLQKLFAKSCFNLNFLQEALETYRHILFLNPKDQESLDTIKNLEKKLGNVQRNRNDGPKNSIQFDLSSLNLDPLSSEENFEEWVKVNWGDQEELTTEKRPCSNFSGLDGLRPISAPVATYTLVELYIRQGYLFKAKQALEKMLRLHGENKKLLAKKCEIEFLLKQQNIAFSPGPEEKGHQNLSCLIEEVKSKELGSGVSKTKFLLGRFNDAIQKKAKERGLHPQSGP